LVKEELQGPHASRETSREESGGKTGFWVRILGNCKNLLEFSDESAGKRAAIKTEGEREGKEV